MNHLSYSRVEIQSKSNQIFHVYQNTYLRIELVTISSLPKHKQIRNYLKWKSVPTHTTIKVGTTFILIPFDEKYLKNSPIINAFYGHKIADGCFGRLDLKVRRLTT